MGLQNKDMEPTSGPITGFSGGSILPRGEINLPVTLGNEELGRTALVRFQVVEAYSPYNIIMGHTFMSAFEGVASTYHLCFKYV